MIHGSCLTVGVGGYLLKGGAMLGRSTLYGDGASHVIRYTMVNANGDILWVDRDYAFDAYCGICSISF